MMLDERTGATIKLEANRDEATSDSSNGVNFAANHSHVNFVQSGANLENHAYRTYLPNNLFGNPQDISNITRSDIKSEPHQQQQQQHQQQQQQQQQQQHQAIQGNYKDHFLKQHTLDQLNEEQYLTSDETNSNGYNQNPDTPASASGSYDNNNSIPLNPPSHSLSSVADANVDTRRHSLMVPTTAHCSEHQLNMHYSLSNTAKSLPASSPSNMALNFSHDLLQGHSTLHHHHPNDNTDHKHGQLSASLDLESGSHLMQAANMNMWKSSMGLGFKHSAINEHSPFLPTSDVNNFSNWPHANNLTHQTAPAMSHPILDSQHLIGYSQHNQRSLQLQNQQDLVGASLKNQVCAEQASLMLNSINQAQMGDHHSSSHQSSDNQHLRSNSHDHTATSYNLSINDNHFYNNRSHPNANKSSLFLQDRSGPSHSNHHASHLSYHSAEHLNQQATTSHHVAAGSSSGSSRNIGTFKCPHCSEIFNMRNVYQTHLKSHSQEKGSKSKFHCELCGHSFSQKTSLNRHMKSHTGERPFPCEVCGKAFSEKERLKIHMRTHTGEKPFSCGICGKSFSQKSTVKRHQTVHTGEKKFKCDCGKGFANRGNLIAHIKTRGANHFE